MLALKLVFSGSITSNLFHKELAHLAEFMPRFLSCYCELYLLF
jgi:hypothetical protein